MSPTDYSSLKAKEAGKYLATLLGNTSPIPEQSMWRLARQRKIPHKRLSRQILFRTDWLERFAAEDDSGLIQQLSNSRMDDDKSV